MDHKNKPIRTPYTDEINGNDLRNDQEMSYLVKIKT